ncbi:MAG: hypothetical protein RIR09_1014 [Pseudomonadota bacterium]|jgi:hypothetical protein
MLEEAKQVCPTTTQRLVREGALLMDVRDRNEVAALAFNVPDIVNVSLLDLEQRWAHVSLHAVGTTRLLVGGPLQDDAGFSVGVSGEWS